MELGRGVAMAAVEMRRGIGELAGWRAGRRGGGEGGEGGEVRRWCWWWWFEIDVEQFGAAIDQRRRSTTKMPDAYASHHIT